MYNNFVGSKVLHIESQEYKDKLGQICIYKYNSKYSLMHKEKDNAENISSCY